MTKNIPCLTCDKVTPMELVSRTETLTYKGKDVSYEAEFFRCTVCGTEIEEPGQLDKNLDAAREMYDRLYATPSKEALVALREGYGASQKAFSLLLGFGETTMNNYEKGHTPDSANRLLLQLAQDPVVFRKIYELNKNKIGLLQRKRIEASEAFQVANSWRTVFKSDLAPPVVADFKTQWTMGFKMDSAHETQQNPWGGIAR